MLILISLVLAVATTADAEQFKTWAKQQGKVCEWGVSNLGEGPAFIAKICNDRHCATVIEYAGKRWWIEEDDDPAKCSENPPWSAPDGEQVFEDTCDASTFTMTSTFGIRSGALVKLGWSGHSYGSAPPPRPPSMGYAQCFDTYIRRDRDTQLFVTPVAGSAFDARHRARSGPVGPIKGLACGDRDAEVEFPNQKAFRIGTTQQVVTHGAKWWSGHGDASLQMSARMAGDDLLLDVTFADDAATLVDEASPSSMLKGDHLELWWTTKGYTAGQSFELSKYGEVNADWGAVPKKLVAEAPEGAVASVATQMKKVRQLGIAQVKGQVRAVWLFPEGLSKPVPLVTAIKGGFQIRLARAGLDVRTQGKDWSVPLTAVFHDVDDGKVTLVASSQLQWGAPGSFGQVRHFGRSPYDSYSGVLKPGERLFKKGR